MIEISVEAEYLFSPFQVAERINELLKNIHKAQMQQKEAEFKALQSQINPHFIYNTLESIRMIAELGESEKAADMTQTLGRLMRYSFSGKDFCITLKNEVEHVVSYLDIHKIRMGDRIYYLIDIKPDISHFPCPKFILQPLVENCIIHGIGILRRKGIIRISIEEDNEYMIIKISDNGAGISEDMLKSLNERLAGTYEPSGTEESHGIGIMNVNARIREYYGGEFRITIDSKLNESTSYTVRLLKKGWSSCG